MTLVRFFRADGSLDKEGRASRPALLDVAWAAGQPLEGACEGVWPVRPACAGRRRGFRQIAAASEEEEDLLDLAAHAGRTSRLACQIMLTSALERLACEYPRRRPTGWGGSQGKFWVEADDRHEIVVAASFRSDQVGDSAVRRLPRRHMGDAVGRQERRYLAVDADRAR